MALRWVIDGPTDPNEWFLSDEQARKECTRLNAAYKQGQQDRWIPVSQFKAPAPGTIILFGSKATVRMWTWDANNDEPPSSWATHFQLIELPPNPERG
jgi:hypothetical protein